MDTFLDPTGLYSTSSASSTSSNPLDPTGLYWKVKEFVYQLAEMHLSSPG